MSVFGGDSWAPEAKQRKRRVDELMLTSSSSSYKKISSGKFVCLVCPHNPVLDSPLILSMHMKGSRHIAAETWLKERELSKLEEVNKRITLSGDSKDFSNSVASFSKSKGSTIQNKPLIEKTRKAILETQSKRIPAHNKTQPTFSVVPLKHNEGISGRITAVESVVSSDWNVELRKRREKELHFTSAGWKRDGNGKWYKDENVEFDSDDEDPNAFLG